MVCSSFWSYLSLFTSLPNVLFLLCLSAQPEISAINLNNSDVSSLFCWWKHFFLRWCDFYGVYLLHLLPGWSNVTSWYNVGLRLYSSASSNQVLQPLRHNWNMTHITISITSRDYVITMVLTSCLSLTNHRTIPCSFYSRKECQDT